MNIMRTVGAEHFEEELYPSVRVEPQSAKTPYEIGNPNTMSRHRGLRRVSRAAHVDGLLAHDNRTHYNSSGLTLSGDDAASAEKTYSGSQLLVSILCMLILAPCVLATIMQCIYSCKKWRRDRAEREVLAVSTNPASRMLVLSEIFKNDSRPVTEENASPRKKRVLVKKYRKKTPAERQHKSDDDDESCMDNESGDNSDEEAGIRHRGSSFDEKPMIVYVSSFEHRDSHSDIVAAYGVSSAVGQDSQDGDIYSANANDEKLVVSNVNEVNDVTVDNREGPSSPLGEGEKLTPDGDEIDSCTNENDQVEEGEAVDGVREDIAGKKENKQGVGDDQSFNDEGEVHVVPSGGINDDELSCNKNFKDDDLDSTSAGGEVVIASSTPDVAHECDKPKAGSMAEVSTPQTVLLAPKIPFMPSLDDNANESEETLLLRRSLADTTLQSNAPGSPTAASLQQKNRTSHDLPTADPSTPIRLTFANLSDDSDDEMDVRCDVKYSIFRPKNGEDEDCQGIIPAIQGSGSSVTEVTSNVDALKGSSFDDTIKLSPLCATAADGRSNISMFPPYQSLKAKSEASNTSGLRAAIPIKSVGSYKSVASSNVSYFSYDDVSIASEESELCAICLCPYENGDVRIFSKRCVHAYHKECILEWLVKGHQECPCCRIDMVTKSEIKETSASLIGTERLAQALANSEMSEAPPLRGVRSPRLARQMIARARAQRRRSQAQGAGGSGLIPPQSPNSNWLWSARFNNGQSNSQRGANPSTPGRFSELITGTNNNGANTRNRDWLWATRFGDSSSDIPQPRTINPTRSSDAILNPHETNQNIDPAPGATRPSPSLHNTAAGSLFSSSSTMFHDHWQQQSSSPRRRSNQQTAIDQPTEMNQPATMFHDHWQRRSSSSSPRHRSSQIVTLSPSRMHPNWRQNSSNSSNVEAERPVTVRPAI